jgi:hypothetical protein
MGTTMNGAKPGQATPNAADYVQVLAQANRAALLAKAEGFADLYAPIVTWRRVMKHGNTSVLVQREWPDITAVYDPKTGELLAKSCPTSSSY